MYRRSGADTLRTETAGRPDSSDTNASHRPFGEMRASRSTNDSRSSGRAGACGSNGTAHTSPPDTLTTRKPSGDQSVGSQYGRGHGSVCTGPTPSELETFSVGAALVPDRYA